MNTNPLTPALSPDGGEGDCAHFDCLSYEQRAAALGIERGCLAAGFPENEEPHFGNPNPKLRKGRMRAEAWGRRLRPRVGEPVSGKVGGEL